MLHVSHFDVVPFGDWLYVVAQEQSGGKDPETQRPFRFNFGLYGYETNIFMLNLAEFWLVTMILGGALVLFLLLKRLSLTMNWTRVLNKSQHNLDQFRYNVVIRHILEFYIDLGLFSLINLINVLKGDSTLYVFSFVMSIFFTVLVFIMPYIVYKLVQLKQKLLVPEKERNFSFEENQEEFKEQSDRFDLKRNKTTDTNFLKSESQLST